MLSLVIRGIQHSQDPTHLWPATHQYHPGPDALGLDSDFLETNAARTLRFFGFLRVSEFTTSGRGTFDPRIHPTKQDITWSKNGLLFFIKNSKTDQAGVGTTILVGRTRGETCPVSATSHSETITLRR